MTTIKTKAKDGTPVEFVYKDPMQGGVKDVYFAPDKSYVVAFFRKNPDIAGQERIEKLVGQYRKGIFEQAGGEYWKKLFCWPEKIVEYDGKIGMTVPAYQPISRIFSSASKRHWPAPKKRENGSPPPKILTASFPPKKRERCSVT